MEGSIAADPMQDARLAGVLAASGAGLMLAGAGLWASTGADIDLALVREEMPAYLAAAAGHRTTLIANLVLWIIGALVLGAAGTVMAGVGTGAPALRSLARYVYGVAAAVVTGAFLAWMALIVQGSAEPAAVDVAIARIVGWYAYRADCVATALIVGVGPALVSAAGRGEWVPRWLFTWGLVAAAAGIVSFAPYFVAGLPHELTLVIVPAGIGWTIAAAVVLLRGAR
jgi:hypothetical protein